MIRREPVASRRELRDDMPDALFSIKDLSVEFDTPEGVVRAVNGVSFDVHPGETLGIVGESGSGKSITVLAALGLLARSSAKVLSGSVTFEGRDLLRLPERALRHIRGNDIGLVFQDPSSALDPVATVGRQLVEAIRVHARVSKPEARSRCIDLLTTVGIPEAPSRFDQYPHEYSGGMKQRAMIAMAMANHPRLLIADEPTTALDVTIQAQVLRVLRHAKEESGAAGILITHDLGIIAEMADRVVVMYSGRVVEIGTVYEVFHTPRHPYTCGLLASLPPVDVDVDTLPMIPGTPPAILPSGCAFHPRCDLSGGRKRCREEVPQLSEVGNSGQWSACHFSGELEYNVGITDGTVRFRSMEGDM